MKSVQKVNHRWILHLSAGLLLSGSPVLLADKVQVEDLMYAEEQAIDAKVLHRELASGPLDGLNQPDWLTAGNQPNWYTAGNQPDWITAGNQPDWLTAGHQPSWYISASLMNEFAQSGKLPSPTRGEEGSDEK